MKTTLAALIAPAVAFALLFAAVTAHADPRSGHLETPAEHAAHVAALIKAPLTACTARPLATGGTVLVCAVGR